MVRPTGRVARRVCNHHMGAKHVGAAYTGKDLLGQRMRARRLGSGRTITINKQWREDNPGGMRISSESME
eukprot:10857895-Alexandrium_andersonii.AAC.1